jgi:hypothetical protein
MISEVLIDEIRPQALSYLKMQVYKVKGFDPRSDLFKTKAQLRENV